MAKHTVNVDEAHFRSRRRMTAHEWLTECRVEPGAYRRPAHFRFLSPVWLTFDQGEGRQRERFTESPALFRRLSTLVSADAVLIGVRSADWKLAPKGLFTLNHALRTPAVRKGGLNIVRHFLENQRGSRIALKGDFDALLSYLEIRPVFRAKTPKQAPVPTPKISAS